MKMPNTPIVALSVFYHTGLWQKFIAECLMPCFLQQKRNQEVTGVFIAFNFLQGSNIRIALDFKDDQENRAMLLHELFSAYLINNPSDDININYIGNSLFMNFSNNTCQHDLFGISFNNPQVRIQLLLSEKILEVFSAKGYDDSAVFTFLLHVIIALSTEWESLHPTDHHTRIVRTLLEKFSAESPEHLEAMLLPYRELFMANRDMILDIHKEVALDSSPANSWSELKKEYKQYLLSSPAVSDLNTILMPLDLIIANQLALNDQSLLALYFLIHLIYSDPGLKEHSHVILFAAQHRSG